MILSYSSRLSYSTASDAGYGVLSQFFFLALQPESPGRIAPNGVLPNRIDALKCLSLRPRYSKFSLSYDNAGVVCDARSNSR